MSRKDEIERLTAAKFPFYRLLRKQAQFDHGDIQKEARAKLEEINRYKGELQHLSDQEFRALLTQERAAREAAFIVAAERQLEERRTQDQMRFWNTPDAQANLDYWASLASWTLEEAVALSLRKEPTRVDLEELGPIP